MSQLCTWCGTAYEPRSNGGKPQEFCTKDCRQNFNTACRIWGAQEYRAERLSIFALRTCLYQHARCVEGDPPPEGTTTAPETGERPDGPLRAAAPMADVR